MSAWSRVAGRAHQIEQMCLAPRTDSRNRQTASARENRPIQRDRPHFGGPPPLTDATCHDGPLLRRTD